MATVVSGPVITFSAAAGADLSDKQFYFVKWDSGGLIVCDDLTDVPAGVLQNKPESGYAAEIIAFGPSKVSADAAITQGAFIGPSGDGQADPRVIGTDTTHYVAGVALEAASNAAEIISALINCVNCGRAA